MCCHIACINIHHANNCTTDYCAFVMAAFNGISSMYMQLLKQHLHNQQEDLLSEVFELSENPNK